MKRFRTNWLRKWKTGYSSTQDFWRYSVYFTNTQPFGKITIANSDSVASSLLQRAGMESGKGIRVGLITDDRKCKNYSPTLGELG